MLRLVMSTPDLKARGKAQEWLVVLLLDLLEHCLEEDILCDGKFG
jgi:hypothetical protein